MWNRCAPIMGRALLGPRLRPLLLRWLLAALVLGGCVWFVSRRVRGWLERQAE